MSRQQSQSDRFAPSDTTLAHARAAFAALPSSASPEKRAPYQFALGLHLLWHGDLSEAETELRLALQLAEQIGDVTLQARCLTYLTTGHRRQGHAADVEANAHRALAVAESSGELNYLGAGRANLAWVAWRGGDLVEAERGGQAALEAWRLSALPYPLYWQALWPLLGVAVGQDRPADAVTYARQLCDPSQQVLPARLEELLNGAIAAWDAGQPDQARDFLRAALDFAQQMHFS